MMVSSMCGEGACDANGSGLCVVVRVFDQKWERGWS